MWRAGNASLWLGLQDGSVTKALADSIPVTFEATLPMHIAGCALPSSSEPSTLLTALYQETAGPDYLLLYEAPPPYTHWKVRSRVTPAGQVGNENWMVRLPDGRLVLVMRDFAPSALGITVSSTDGHTWYLLLSPPIPLRLALPKWVDGSAALRPDPSVFSGPTSQRCAARVAAQSPTTSSQSSSCSPTTCSCCRLAARAVTSGRYRWRS